MNVIDTKENRKSV